MGDVKRIIADCTAMRKLLTDTTELDRQISEKTQESELLANMARELIFQKASSSSESSNIESEQEDNLYARFDAVTQELQSLNDEREARLKKDKALSLHIRTLKNSKQILTEWDDTVWTVMVEKAIIHKDKTITFIFYNGSLVRVGM